VIFIKYLRPILWAFFIALLCGMPGKDIPKVSWLEWVSFDKFVHAAMFFILYFLFIKSYIKAENSVGIRNTIFITFAIACIAYGGILEILQGTFFIDRSADVSDFIANSFGVFASYIFLKRRISFPQKL
jgi:VanZ family protein